MDRDCGVKKAKAAKRRCCAPKCKKKEVISMKCDVCGDEVCLTHRHPQVRHQGSMMP